MYDKKNPYKIKNGGYNFLEKVKVICILGDIKTEIADALVVGTDNYLKNISTSFPEEI